MTTPFPLRRVFVGALFFFPALAAQAQQVFRQGFETFPAGAAIKGQPVGAGAWNSSGVLDGDLAQVTDASAFEGAQSLLIADQGGSRPRASIDLVASRQVPAPIAAGAVSFAIREDANDEGAADAFSVNLGAISLLRANGPSLSFSVKGGGWRTVPFAGNGYVYTPGAWNTLRVEFDNATKSATLFINGGEAATIAGSSGDFTVGALTFGTYSSGSVGDALFFDAVEVVVGGGADDAAASVSATRP